METAYLSSGSVTRESLAELIRTKAGRSAHFSVAPRYTCGSPAMVSMETAVRVAVEEREAYEQCLDGVMGEELQRTARARGLANIAYARWEKGSKVWRLDLLAGGDAFIEPPRLGYKDEARLRLLRLMKVNGGAEFGYVAELALLESRAALHRQKVA